MDTLEAGFKTPLRRRESNKRWRRAHPEKFAQYYAKYTQKHVDRRIWSVAKQRSKKRGIEFSITPDDIVVPSHCPVFGFELITGSGRSGRQGGNYNSPSLDRIDPALGYVPGNVRVISHMANSMKGAATRDQLRQFAEWVLKQ